jgi:hypothetical protein
VDWVALEDNVKYGVWIRQVGSDDLGDGLSIPPYYFLQGSIRVRPMEANHTLTITGNLFVEGGGDPIVSTLGNFNVLVKSVVPVQAQGISTSGSTAPTVAEIVAGIMSQAVTTPIHSDVRLTTIGTATPSQIAAAVRSALIMELSRLDVPISTRTEKNDVVLANITTINGRPIVGKGTKLNPWKPI